MNEAAQLTKSQRRNTKKRERKNEKEKSAAHEAEIRDDEALKVEAQPAAQRNLNKLSKWSPPLVDGRLHEKGDPLVENGEWVSHRECRELIPA